MAVTRCLSREEAAALLGIGVDCFDAWRRKGILPGPVPGTRRWDRKALEKALDRVSKLESDGDASAFDEWKRARSHPRHQQGDQAPR